MDFNLPFLFYMILYDMTFIFLSRIYFKKVVLQAYCQLVPVAKISPTRVHCYNSQKNSQVVFSFDTYPASLYYFIIVIKRKNYNQF